LIAEYYRRHSTSFPTSLVASQQDRLPLQRPTAFNLHQIQSPISDAVTGKIDNEEENLDDEEGLPHQSVAHHSQNKKPKLSGILRYAIDKLKEINKAETHKKKNNHVQQKELLWDRAVADFVIDRRLIVVILLFDELLLIFLRKHNMDKRLVVVDFSK
jgi:hypothetical protein